jgi:hypothetical protein
MEIRIVPENPEFIAGIIEITTFIKKLDCVCQGEESMGKSGRNINLILFLGG